MGKGYTGKILWVDLTKGVFKDEYVDDKIYEDFLGGYGLAAKIIFDRQAPGLSPFDPGNILAMMSGLLTNGRAIFNGRWMLAGKSPLTGTWGDSNCGGDFAPAIKDTGYDGIFFTGMSKKPVYLYIDGDIKKLKDASEMWKKMDAVDTETYLKKIHGEDFRVACIGSGGENLSLISGVVNAKGRIAARSGLGALMGSKNLKAVCLRGDTEVDVYDEDEVWASSTQLLKDLVDKLNDFGKTMKNCGTAGTLTDSAESGDSPVKNWLGVGKKDFPPNMADKINGFSITKYEKSKYHCYSCPFGCGGICHVPGQELLKETHRPEYETLCGFGTQLLNDDLESIFLVNEMLNRAGIDTISCATTINWAFEAFEKGIITPEQTGELGELRWGRSRAVVELVRQIINAEGLGRYLKDGLQVAEQNLNPSRSGAVAMHVHGQELPMHDSRMKDEDLGGLDLGIGYEVEPTPGRHTSTFTGIDDYIKDENKVLNKWRDKLKFQRKYKVDENTDPQSVGMRFKNSSCAEDVVNGLGLCNFGFYLGPKVPFVEWANATTGWNYTLEDYLKIGQRIKTVRHAFNLREKLNVVDFKMPERARGNPPMKQGPNAYSPNVLYWDDMKQEYYEAMGWDRETAVPLKNTLDDLDLPEVKEALYGVKIPC
jgi:aldehyde:ferredoxin oxidoreductase